MLEATKLWFTARCSFCSFSAHDERPWCRPPCIYERISINVDLPCTSSLLYQHLRCALYNSFSLPLLSFIFPTFIIYIYHFFHFISHFCCLGKTSTEKKTFSFGHCPNMGGGSTHARIFWPYFLPSNSP